MIKPQETGIQPSNPLNKHFKKQDFGRTRIGTWYWDMQTGEISINQASAELIGQSLENLLPMNTTKWASLCLEQDRHLVTERLQEFSTGEFPYFLEEFRVKQKAGDYAVLQVSGNIIEYKNNKPKIMAGSVTNINELYYSRLNLKYRYEIEKLVAGISAEFVGIQHDKLDEAINHTIEKIGTFSKIDRSYVFRLRDNDAIIDNTHEWCAAGIKPEIENLQGLPVTVFSWWMNKLNKQEPIHIHDINELPEEAAMEKEILKAQGIISLLTVPIHYKNKLLGFMGFDSVRQQKEWSEADIHLLATVGNIVANALNAKQNQELLIQAKEKAEENDRIKSAFLATINHELRTPLHHILGFSNLLKSKKLTLQQSKNFASTINESGKKLLQIVEDIFSLALADQSEIIIRNETFQGCDIFTQHKVLLEELLLKSNKQNNIDLVCFATPQFRDTTFSSDQFKINQVILNLFKNAVKFTKAGSIEYRASLDDESNLIFSTKDTGVGIPPDKHQLIFDYFRQGDDTNTRSYNGVGIGLAIARKITELLNGSITVESSYGAGSTFTLRIPVEIVSADNNA